MTIFLLLVLGKALSDHPFIADFSNAKITIQRDCCNWNKASEYFDIGRSIMAEVSLNAAGTYVPPIFTYLGKAKNYEAKTNK